MDENNKHEETAASEKQAEVTIESPALKKFENFMYYHKWHTVAALVLIFAVIVCTVQMCSRESGDISFFYVHSENLNEPQRRSISSAVTDTLMADDEDCRVSFLSHYIVSTDMLKEMESADTAYLGNTSFENANVFRTELATSEAYICIFSRDVYDLSLEYFPYKRDPESGAFISQLYRPISDFTDKDIPSIDGYAVYLKDTPLRHIPAFASLDKNGDTVVCMRVISYAATVQNKKLAKKLYARHELLFERMLSYTPASEE